ncbi:MAG: hypothetical protein BroJett040_13630 [Oligoflexia bacterium]|nr:MAG: hypothetical protein BroJett040_13630 [Oligoflexia bacterium]
MIKAIVFDLDDTLLDTSGLLIPIAETPEFFLRIQRPLPLMPGALENLHYLKPKYHLILMTQGKIPVQKQKIVSLGIEVLFHQIVYVDIEANENKQMAFENLIQSGHLTKGKFLSVGNRLSTDIREAKRSGGFTCWFKYGEHQDEKPRFPEDFPDYTVLSHQEIISTCHL